MDVQKGKCWRELVQRFGVKALPTDYLRKPNRVLEPVRVVMPPNISDEHTVYRRQQSRTSSSDDKHVFPCR